ncbi:MAG TPA: guanylate kinase, partial [Limnochordales bacterium]
GYSISVTTRPPRPGERDGVDYFFVGEAAFQEMVKRQELLEWARFGEYLYGTPRSYIEQALARRQVVLLDVDIQGARQLRRAQLPAVFVFLVPPSLEALRQRLLGRGSDSPEQVERRMQLALTELQAVADYDYVVVNEGLQEAADLLEAIILAEACRPGRARLPRWGQPQLGEGSSPGSWQAS